MADTSELKLVRVLELPVSTSILKPTAQLCCTSFCIEEGINAGMELKSALPISLGSSTQLPLGHTVKSLDLYCDITRRLVRA